MGCFNTNEWAMASNKWLKWSNLSGGFSSLWWNLWGQRESFRKAAEAWLCGQLSMSNNSHTRWRVWNQEFVSFQNETNVNEHFFPTKHCNTPERLIAEGPFWEELKHQTKQRVQVILRDSEQTHTPKDHLGIDKTQGNYLFWCISASWPRILWEAAGDGFPWVDVTSESSWFPKNDGFGLNNGSYPKTITNGFVLVVAPQILEVMVFMMIKPGPSKVYEAGNCWLVGLYYNSIRNSSLYNQWKKWRIPL